jgi:large subunit ribosomal protein L13
MAFGTTTGSAVEARRQWYLVDASDAVLGRLASRIARVLSGKHRPSFVPHLDSGDFVIVTNAERVRLTGNKLDAKVYRRHTGYPGGLRSIAAKDLQARFPERLIEEAVRGMLPKSKLGRRQIRKLKVYRGASHPHEAQQPRPLKLAAGNKPAVRAK